VAGREVAVAIVRHRLARRYVVRVGDDGGVRLTVPRGASIAGGLAFAGRQAEWIAGEQRRGRERGAPWAHGTVIWFRGRQVPIEVLGGVVSLGEETLGPRTDGEPLREFVQRSLRARAAAEFVPRTLALALEHGVTVSAVTVRNQRSRWGTCSPRQAISLNWRLIQMPASVSDYVVLHELMHLRQPNHSRRFWREVAGVCPWWRDAERWLRGYGKELI
jgi:predicted metal-dependent hydrolase